MEILNVSFSELRLCLIFTFYEAVEGLTCNEQFLLVLSGQKRIKHCYNINSRILSSEK